MKKIKFLTLAFLGTAFVLLSVYACSNDAENEKILQNTEKNLSKVESSSTDFISIVLLDLGVKYIEVTNSQIKFQTFGNFAFHDKFIDLSNYTITQGQDILNQYYLKTNNSKLVVKKDGNISLFRGKVEIDPKKYKTDLIIDDLVLILTYNQFSSDEKEKMTATEYATVSKSKGCPIWKIRRALGWGFTPAEAESDLWGATYEFAKNYMGKGCTSIGGVSHKSVGLIDVAIQSFCCP